MDKDTVKYLVILVLALLVLGIAGIFLGKTLIAAKDASDLIVGDLKDMRDECLENTIKIQKGELAVELVDVDQDNFHDGCDICMPGNDLIDGDFDGMPDDCDAEPKNGDNNKCKGEWNNDENACKLER